MSKVIRVDREVHEQLLRTSHVLELQEGHRVSFSEAAAALIGVRTMCDALAKARWG